MNEITYEKSYQEYKAELDGELQKTAEGFVKIGYLLKVARDTNVLAESGYTTVTEFAEAEYNLNKTQVSRFISINDKFSENGYSDHLMPEYKGFGYAKLTIMLQLPDTLNEELTPEYSKQEIQAIKDEVDEERKVSDVERYLEGSDNLENVDPRLEMLYKAVLQLGEDKPELYTEISAKKNEDMAEVLQEIMAPAGDKMYSIRIRGTGRVMLTISELSDTVKLINERSGEKEVFTWDDVAAAWIYAGVLGSATEDQTPEECWEQKYERKYPIAPVQPEEEKKPEKRKEPKVVKAKPEKKPEPAKTPVLEPKTKEEPEKEEKPAEKEPEAAETLEFEQTEEEMQQEESEDEENTEDHAEDMPVDHTLSVGDQDADITEQEEKTEQIPGTDTESGHTGTVPVHRLGQQETLENRKTQVKQEIRRELEELQKALGNEAWNTAKMYLDDIRQDVIRIEKIEDEMEDLADESQINLEDILNAEEKE